MRKASIPILAAAVIGLVLVGLSASFCPTPILIWNASASVPVGLYLADSGTPKRGDFVLVHTPNSIAELAAERGYLPIGIPLIKHIAAGAGDAICASNLTVSINGKTIAHQLATDRAGRSLPRWNGCRRLNLDEYFLLAEAPDSFDSRYFGSVTGNQIIGRLVPLWLE